MQAGSPIARANLDRRTNLIQAAYVSAAVTMAKVGRAERAERLLIDQSVPDAVINRVLHGEGPRRPTAHEERLEKLNEQISAARGQRSEE